MLLGILRADRKKPTANSTDYVKPKSFLVKPRARQGFLLSPDLFSLNLEALAKTVELQKSRGTRWGWRVREHHIGDMTSHVKIHFPK